MPIYPDDIQVSLHGRRLGLDKDDYLITKGLRLSVVAGSTATTIAQGGLTSLSSSSGTFTLEAPRAGLEKLLTTLTTSTLVRTVTLASGNFQTTSGSSFITATFAGQNFQLRLMGLSTAIYSVVNNVGPVTFST
jgi:hypothetical protein